MLLILARKGAFVAAMDTDEAKILVTERNRHTGADDLVMAFGVPEIVQQSWSDWPGAVDEEPTNVRRATFEANASGEAWQRGGRRRSA